jgi:hypothetical protein
MTDEETGARARKKRLHSKRAEAGLAQISAWVPIERRSYARDVLKAVASGANSLPPDPEIAAELAEARAKIEQIEAEAAQQRNIWEAEREAARESQAKAQERIVEALQRAEKAEAAIRQAKAMPGLKGRLVRWLAGDVLPD